MQIINNSQHRNCDNIWLLIKITSLIILWFAECFVNKDGRDSFIQSFSTTTEIGLSSDQKETYLKNTMHYFQRRVDYSSFLHFVIVTICLYSGDDTFQGPKLTAALSPLTSEYVCTHCATSPNTHLTHQEVLLLSQSKWECVDVVFPRGVSVSFRVERVKAATASEPSSGVPGWLSGEQTVGSAACRRHLLQIHSRL